MNFFLSEPCNSDHQHNLKYLGGKGEKFAGVKKKFEAPKKGVRKVSNSRRAGGYKKISNAKEGVKKFAHL